MDSEIFWTAVALLLVFEGLFPFISPPQWRRMFVQLLQLNDGQVRFFGLCSMVGGVVLLWFLR